MKVLDSVGVVADSFEEVGLVVDQVTGVFEVLKGFRDMSVDRCV